MTPLRLSSQQRERMERVALRECGNCGRKHWGIYSVFSHFEYGDEIDWTWTDRQGNQKVCVHGHERDACEPARCWECDYRS